MPLGEDYASKLVVKINGRALAPDVLDLLVSAYVDDSVHLPSMFVLRFSDERDLVLGKTGAAIGATATVAVQQSGAGVPVELIDGDITALEQEIDDRGVFTTVRGLDVRRTLQHGATVRAFVDVAVSDVVRTVAQGHGVRCEVDSFPPLHKHLAQDNESDWDFLRRLASQVGAVVHVTGRTLHFARPTAASAAPGTTEATTEALVIERGANLRSLCATVTGAGQVTQTESRGWDPATKKEISAVEPAATTAASLRLTPAALAAELGGERHVVGRSGLTVGETAASEAAATAAARAGGFAEVEGVVRGNPRLRAGTAVNLAGVGASFAGQYVLSAVRHEVDPVDGYLTSFTAADASDRSLYGVVAAGPPPPQEAHRGVLTAVVTNLKDPDGRGRVKLKFPVLADAYESWWARPLQAGAGPGRGGVVLPEVGDEVLVAFGQGAFDEPYVLGGLYNGADQPRKAWSEHVGSDGKVVRRGFTSRNGMVVEFVEDGQQDTVTIATNDGAQHLTLTQTGTKGIVLVSQGPLEVTAEQDVTVTGKQNVAVSASNGDMTLGARNVTIEATQKLALKGLEVAAEAQTSAELKGAVVKVEAQTNAELAGNAVTTIRGGIVKIN